MLQQLLLIPFILGSIPAFGFSAAASAAADVKSRAANVSAADVKYRVATASAEQNAPQAVRSAWTAPKGAQKNNGPTVLQNTTGLLPELLPLVTDYLTYSCRSRMDFKHSDSYRLYELPDQQLALLQTNGGKVIQFSRSQLSKPQAYQLAKNPDTPLEQWNVVLQLRNGKIVTGCMFRGEINIWDLHSGVCEATLKHGGVMSLLELPNGKLASGSDDRSIKIWDIVSEKCIQDIQAPHTAQRLFDYGDGFLVAYDEWSTFTSWQLQPNNQYQLVETKNINPDNHIVLEDGRVATRDEDQVTISDGKRSITVRMDNLKDHEFLLLKSFARGMIIREFIGNSYKYEGFELWDLNANPITCISCKEAVAYPMHIDSEGRLIVGRTDGAVLLVNRKQEHNPLELITHPEQVGQVLVLQNGGLACLSQNERSGLVTICEDQKRELMQKGSQETELTQNKSTQPESGCCTVQ
jgi:hypothetical protein